MTEYVWDFQNNALWDTHLQAYRFNTTSLCVQLSWAAAY